MLTFRLVVDDRYSGIYFLDKSSKRGYKDVLERRSDLYGATSIGSPIYKSFEVILTGAVMKLHWLLPYRRPISLFTVLISENLVVMLLLFILLTTTVLTWWILNHPHHSFGEAFTSIASISMSLSVPSVPCKFMSKVFLLICFVGFLPLDVCIQCIITSTLSQPKMEPKISTPKQLIESNLWLKYDINELKTLSNIFWQSDITPKMLEKAEARHFKNYTEMRKADFYGEEHLAMLVQENILRQVVKNLEDVELLPTVRIIR